MLCIGLIKAIPSLLFVVAQVGSAFPFCFAMYFMKSLIVSRLHVYVYITIVCGYSFQTKIPV